MLENTVPVSFYCLNLVKKNYTLTTATHKLFNVYEESISSIEQYIYLFKNFNCIGNPGATCNYFNDPGSRIRV